jgi:ABC-type transporter MlaC component
VSAQSTANNLRNGNDTVLEMMSKAKSHAMNTTKLNHDERSIRIQSLIKKYINLDFMAKATTGSFWKKASKDQKEKYKEALLNQIVNTIEDHLNKLSTLSYTPLDSELRGKKLVYVRGKIEDLKNKRPPVNLLWKLAASSKKSFLVLDLEIEGISLVSSHKAETMHILRKNRGNFDALLDKLNNVK